MNKKKFFEWLDGINYHNWYSIDSMEFCLAGTPSRKEEYLILCVDKYTRQSLERCKFVIRKIKAQYDEKGNNWDKALKEKDKYTRWLEEWKTT